MAHSYSTGGVSKKKKGSAQESEEYGEEVEEEEDVEEDDDINNDKMIKVTKIQMSTKLKERHFNNFLFAFYNCVNYNFALSFKCYNENCRRKNQQHQRNHLHRKQLQSHQPKLERVEEEEAAEKHKNSYLLSLVGKSVSRLFIYKFCSYKSAKISIFSLQKLYSGCV